MIDFWNGMRTPDGVVWFNRFTNEYEFEKRPDGFDAYLLGKRACEDIATRARAMLLTDVMKGD